MKKELNKLLRLNLDASKGYEYAAEEIENKNFKNFLKSYSRQRLKYADQIRAMMVLRGFDIYFDSSFLGNIHRGIMKLKNSISKKSDDELIAECIRGENESISQYEKTLKQNVFKNEVQKMAIHHYHKIRAAESTLHEIYQVL